MTPTREEQFAEALKGIRANLSWYRSVAGSVSRDDMQSAIDGILKHLRKVEPLLKE